MRKYFALLAVAALALGSTSLQADQFTWVLDHEFSGATSPNGTLVVELLDILGGVQLTVNALEDTTTPAYEGLIGNEKVAELMLNLEDPTVSLTLVDSSPSTFTWRYNQGDNAFKADGDGFFDIWFEFGIQPDTGGSPDFLSAGEKAVFSILGAVSIASFNERSSSYGEGLLVAAHVQGIDKPDIPGVDDEGSGWVTTNGEVPEASTLMLFGSGLSGLLFYVKKKGLIKL